ncbi:DAK2 domain-containing protein [Actinospongicola halichondriae]|uniref:DAK2 domain-containing protein n=1 Tax=Actinospongicola halichondriae TaxID=3236844 RepID=UPI003D3C6E69
MTTLEQLAASDLARAVSAFGDALTTHQDAINRLNVYPVPDGDTGTNMMLTVRSVAEAVAGAGESPDMATTCKAIAHGSLMGARGNSGVILSQLLRGMTEMMRDHEVADASVFAAAITRASELSYEAVQRPVEGTILTVVREAADEARAAAEAGDSLVDTLARTRLAGQTSLDNTPELLPVLKDAGVVDAGAAGFLLFVDALLLVVDGRAIPAPPDAPEGAAERARGGEQAITPETGKHVSELRYEVMYLLEAPDESMAGFREVWAGIGDSIVVVGGEGIYNCHIHTDEIGASIEAAIEIGRPREIRVTDLLDELHEIEEERWVREADTGPEPEPEPVPCGVVAVATGEGIRRIFANLRVQQVVTGGQSMNPSTAQLLEAVEAVPAPEVVILPNNKNIIAVAEQVDELTDKTVRVVPTRSITEGFAGLIGYDPEADVDTNAAAIGELASAVVPGEITQAVRDSTCDAGPIAEGDWLGIARDGIRFVAPDIVDACVGLLDILIDDEREIVTVIEGDGASAGITRQITEWLDEHRPDVEAEVHHGGQPLYPYLFGVE